MATKRKTKAPVKKKRASSRAKKGRPVGWDSGMLACRGCGQPIWAHAPGCMFPNLLVTQLKS